MTQDFSADWIKNFQNLFQEKVKEEFDDLKKPNILIIGRTGVGKSSLINAMFGSSTAKVGSGQPVTDSYYFYSSPDVLVNIYDSAGWEGGSEGEEKFFKDTEDFLNQRRTKNPQDHIYIVWYLIDASSARFTDFDTKILKDVLKNIPVLVILSKGDIATNEQIDSLKDVIAQKTIPNRVDTIDVAANPITKRGVRIFDPYGLDKVVSKTLDILPDLSKRAFIAAQIVSLREKDREATKAIKTFSTTAFVIGFSPIPFSDTPLLITTQSTLIARITVIYGFKPTQTVISALGGIITTSFVANVGLVLADFLKFYPVIGTIIGSIIDGTIAAILTAALGFSFNALFGQITKSIIEGEEVTYTKEWMENFIRERFKQELERLQRSKRIEDYEPLEDES